MESVKSSAAAAIIKGKKKYDKGLETMSQRKSRVETSLTALYHSSLASANLSIPRQMRASGPSELSISSFRSLIRSNRFTHQAYQPQLDTVFGKYLYEGLFDESVD